MTDTTVLTPSWLDSDMQELLGTEELAGDESMSGPQLQWATETEFPSVVRLVELNCCAIPLTAAGCGGIFAVPAREVAAHPSDSCAVVFIEIAADQRDLSDSHQTDGYHMYRRWRELLHGTRHTEDFVDRLAAVEVSGYAPVPTPSSSSPAMLRNSCRFAKDKQPSVAQGALSASSRRRHQPHSSSCQASSRGPSKRRYASSPTSRLCRSTQ